MSETFKSIAIIGTRGIPAQYGGFETLAEELAPRLADRGHDVWVYARRHTIGPLPQTPAKGPTRYRGVTVRILPAPRQKHLETVIHTFLSSIDAVLRGFDAVLLCNTANAVVIPLLRARRIRVVVNVDGLEWRRRKWGTLARAWHRLGARLSVWGANVVVTDARFVQRFWKENLGADPVYIPYGAPRDAVGGSQTLDAFGLEPRRYVLYVGRLEPENNPDLVVEAFKSVRTDYPLVLVGHAPYAARLRSRLQDLAAADPRVILAGPVYGDGYAELQSNAACYIQASEVGGTHPALLEAMAYGGCVIVNDIPEHREVVDDAGSVFAYNDPASLAESIQQMLDEPERAEELRAAARARVRERYDWEEVTAVYESVLLEDAARPEGAIHQRDGAYQRNAAHRGNAVHQEVADTGRYQSSSTDGRQAP